MRRFLFEAIIGLFAVTVLMAVFFRNQRARDALRFFRNVAWAYVLMVVLLAAFHVWQEGF